MSLSPEISVKTFESQTSPNDPALDNKLDVNESAAAAPVEGKLEVTLLECELQSLIEQRHQIRLFDPQGVYFYRHIQCGWFASFLHFSTLLFSIALLFFLFVLWYGARTQIEVSGVGFVTNIMIVDVFELFFVGLIISTALYSLKGELRYSSIKRYRLAMLANAFNRVLYNYCKFTVYFAALILLIIIVNKGDGLFVFNALKDGVSSDFRSAVVSVFNIVIFYRSFSFCHKG